MSALQAVVLTVLYTVANPARGLLGHEYEYIQRLRTGCCNVQPTTGIACARTVMI